MNREPSAGISAGKLARLVGLEEDEASAALAAARRYNRVEELAGIRADLEGDDQAEAMGQWTRSWLAVAIRDALKAPARPKAPPKAAPDPKPARKTKRMKRRPKAKATGKAKAKRSDPFKGLYGL